MWRGSHRHRCDRCRWSLSLAVSCQQIAFIPAFYTWVSQLLNLCLFRMTADRRVNNRTAHILTCAFLLNRPSIWGYLQVRPVSQTFGNCCGRTFTGRCPSQPTASMHWRMTVFLTANSMLPPCCYDRSGTLRWLCGLHCPPVSREHPSCDNDSVPDLETACCHHAVMLSQEHCLRGTFYRPSAFLKGKMWARCKSF